MIRNREVVDTFRDLARRVTFRGQDQEAERLMDQAATLVLQDYSSTGDELIDALVALYERSLTPYAIDRFDALDLSLAGMKGQLALVVDRYRPHSQIPRTIQRSYYAGQLTDESLVTDIRTLHYGKGFISLPTDGHAVASEFTRVVMPDRPAPIAGIYASPYDDGDGLHFLGSGSPNFAKEFYPDGRVEAAFRPTEYATPLDAAESRRPFTEVVLGDEAVAKFMAEDEGFRMHPQHSELEDYLKGTRSVL